MSVDLAELVLSVDANGFVKADRTMSSFNKTASNTEKQADKIAKSTDAMTRSMMQADKAAGLLRGTFGVVTALISAKNITEYSDAWTNVSNTLRGVVDSQEELIKTQAKVIALAKDTSSNLEATARLYSEISRSTKDLGVSQERVIGVTRTINNLFLAGGKSAQAAAGAIMQLNQGFASGVLRGDEFNSVAEGAPRILDAVSQYLGITRGALRDFAAEGGITAEILIGALERYSDEAQRAADITTRTFSQNAELANTLALEWVGTSDAVKQFSSTAGQALVVVAQNLDTITDAATVFAVIIGGRVVAAFVAKTAATMADIAATNAQIAADNSAALGAQRRAVVEQEAALAILNKSRAEAAAATAAVNQARINGIATQSIGGLVVALNQQAIAQARVTASTETYAAATLAANAANARLAAGAAASSIAVTGLNSALALVGGPVGLAVIAGAGLAYLALKSTDAEDRLNKLRAAAEGSGAAITNLGEAGKKNRINVINDEITAATDQMTRLQNLLKQTEGGGFSQKSIDRVRADIEILQTEIKNLNSEMNSLSGASDDLSVSFDQLSSSALGMSLAQLGRDMDENLDKYSKSIDAEKERAKAIADTNQQMLREIDLLGNTSKETEILYDLNHKIIKATEQETRKLITNARALDEANKKMRERAEIVASMAENDSNIDRSIEAMIAKNEDAFVDLISASSQWAVDAIEDSFGKAHDDIADAIKDAASEGLMRGFENNKGIIENFIDTFESSVKSMVLKPALDISLDAFANKFSSIIGQVTKDAAGKVTGGTGLVGSVASAAPYVAVAAAIGSAINSWQDKKFEELTAAYRQGVQSTGTLLGDSNAKSDSIKKALGILNDAATDSLNINRGMYLQLVDINAGISKLAGGIARSFESSIAGINTGTSSSNALGAAALGAGAGLYGATASLGGLAGIGLGSGGIGLLAYGVTQLIGGEFGGFVNSVVGKVGKFISSTSKKVIDSGIKFNAQSLADVLESGTVEAFSYASVQTKKKKLGVTTSNKVKETATALSDSLLDQFGDVFDSAASVLESATGALGLDFDPSKLIIDATKLSLKGLKGDELTAEIESFFSSTLDKFAGTLAQNTTLLVDYQKVGEGAFETLARLATETNTFSQYVKLLSLNMQTAGLGAVVVAQQVAEAAGGFDQLQSSLATYYQNFFTETERANAQMDSLSAAFKDLGYDSVPQTREAFRDLVERLDLTNAADQKTFAGLINLSGTFADLVPVAESLADKIEASSKAATSALEAFKASIAAEKELSAARLKTAQDSVTAAQAERDAAATRYESAQTALEASFNAEISGIEKLRDERLSGLDAELEAAKAVQSANQQAVDSAQSALEDALAAEQQMREDSIKSQIDSYRSAASEAQEYAQSLRSLSDSLRSSIVSMGVDTIESTMARRLAAQSQVDQALAAARSGDFTKAMGLDLSALQSSEGLFTTKAARDFDIGVTQNKLAELAKLADGQATIEEKAYEAATRSADALETQVGQLSSIGSSVLSVAEATKQLADAQAKAGGDAGIVASLEAQIAAEKSAADEQIAKLQSQLDALIGNKDAVLSVDDAIKQFMGAKEALTIADAQLENAKAALALSQSMYDAEIAAYDEIIAQQTALYNSALGIDDSVKSVEYAVNDLAIALQSYTAINNQQQQDLAAISNQQAINDAQSLANETAMKNEIASLRAENKELQQKMSDSLKTIAENSTSSLNLERLNA